MKKLTVPIASIALLVLTITASAYLIPTTAQGSNPNKIHGAPVYVLNILGKKSDWKSQGDFDNPDRHTIFIPENTSEWFLESGMSSGSYGNLTADGTVLIWMTSGPEFAVLDGNSLNDGNASLQVESGHWYVYVVALAKPGGNGTLNGWYYDNEGNACYRLGEVLKMPREKGEPVWVNASGLFYITWQQLLALGYTEEQLVTYFGTGQVGQPVWIFDFLNFLAENSISPDTDYYFWQLDNNGDKHLQVRFYKG